MKRFEYKEPEFNVIITARQDVITASTGGEDTPTGSLGTVSDDWVTGGIGFGV